MPRSTDRRSDPAPGTYRPHVAARRPGGRPSVKPVFRVLVHRQFLGTWNDLPSRVGLENAQQFWDHVATTPGQPPKVGTSSVMKGKHALPKWPGYSKTIHYEITGPGRDAPASCPRCGLPGGTHQCRSVNDLDSEFRVLPPEADRQFSPTFVGRAPLDFDPG